MVVLSLRVCVCVCLCVFWHWCVCDRACVLKQLILSGSLWSVEWSLCKMITSHSNASAVVFAESARVAMSVSCIPHTVSYIFMTVYTVYYSFIALYLAIFFMTIYISAIYTAYNIYTFTQNIMYAFPGHHVPVLFFFASVWSLYAELKWRISLCWASVCCVFVCLCVCVCVWDLLLARVGHVMFTRQMPVMNW